MLAFLFASCYRVLLGSCLATLQRQAVTTAEPCSAAWAAAGPPSHVTDTLVLLARTAARCACCCTADTATGAVQAPRFFVDKGMELFVSQSYSKNLGLYGERIGAVNVVCENKDNAVRCGACPVDCVTSALCHVSVVCEDKDNADRCDIWRGSHCTFVPSSVAAAL
jgi:Aminotransferase class I and II